MTNTAKVKLKYSLYPEYYFDIQPSNIVLKRQQFLSHTVETLTFAFSRFAQIQQVGIF